MTYMSRQQEGFESMRREMRWLYQTICPNFGEMSERNQRKQQDHDALMADTSRSGGYVQESSGPRTSSDQQCINTFRLQFENSCSHTKYSKDKIKADDGTPLKVALYDRNNKIVTYEPFSSMRVHIVAIDGDFNSDQKGVWTRDHIRSKIVEGRPKHAKLLSGNLYFKLQNGVGYLKDATFQDNCCFVPSKKVKLAVMADDIIRRIQEGITDSFRILDSRGRNAKKNLNPSPSDPVYKLKQIAMNGHRRTSLQNNGINTVEDFLIAYSKDDKNLRKILGNIKDHDWNIIVKEAHKCTPKRKISDQHQPIFRNGDSSYLPASCSGQPSHSLQPSFHGQERGIFSAGSVSLKQINVQVMNQHVSSTYDGISSAVPPENLASEFSLQPNTLCQDVMPHEHIGAMEVTKQQVSFAGNESLSVNNITLQKSTTLEPYPNNCNIEHDGNKSPSGSSAENTLDGSTSVQADPPKHGTTSNAATRHRPSATGAAPPRHRRWIATTVATAVVIWKKKVAESPRFLVPVNSGTPETWFPPELLQIQGTPETWFRSPSELLQLDLDLDLKDLPDLQWFE